MVRSILSKGDVEPNLLKLLAVTGGRHRLLPSAIDGCPVVGVGELDSIGRGGQAMSRHHTSGVWTLVDLPPETFHEPLIVVSAGSGTAIVAARENSYTHVTGTGVGGGTLLGLARLLLETASPQEIDLLAARGDPNGADLSLGDVVSGPIGTLPPDATAVNFGRLARYDIAASREDLAAALVTMVGQVIATLAITAARTAQIDRIVVTGHLIDMPSMRRVMMRVGEFYRFPLDLPEVAGYATALGALLFATR